MKQKPVSIMYPNSTASRHYQSIVQILDNPEESVDNSKHKGIRGYIKTIFANKK